MPVTGILPDIGHWNFAKGFACGSADTLVNPIDVAWRYSCYIDTGLHSLWNWNASYYKANYNNMNSEDKCFFAGQRAGELITIVAASAYAAEKSALHEGTTAVVGRSALSKADTYLCSAARRISSRFSRLFSRTAQQE